MPAEICFSRKFNFSFVKLEDTNYPSYILSFSTNKLAQEFKKSFESEFKENRNKCTIKFKEEAEKYFQNKQHEISEKVDDKDCVVLFISNGFKRSDLVKATDTLKKFRSFS